MRTWPLRAWQVLAYGAFALILLLAGHLDSFFNNGTALAKLAGLTLLGVLGFAATQRFIRNPWAREMVRLVPIVAMSALVLAPSLTDERIDEALPVAMDVSSSTTVAAPLRLGDGKIAGIGHRASGQAAIYRLTDGANLVRLEDFSVENGPDYRVYLVRGADKERPTGGTDLGALKGSSGNQNYEVPASVDLTGPYTVLVWCRAFSVPVANATVS